MKIRSRDCNSKSGNEDIFKPTFGIESLHRDSNDNGFGIVNFTCLHHKAESCWRSSSDLS